MAFRIARDISPDPTPKAKPKKSADYLAFVRKLPCILTGKYGVEAAHLSMAATEYGHYGRGRGAKSPDRWALPLCSEAHRRQHEIGESLFWRNAGVDPHILALVIWGLWSDLKDDAEPFASAIINQTLASTGRLKARDE
jgi:uncharacterized protein DUF968